MELKFILESLIFASDKPIPLKLLKTLAGGTSIEPIKKALQELQAEHEDRGIQLVEVSGGYQFRTHPENAAWVKKLLAGRPPRLTQAMLETLAIIAYRQPITRPEIEEIRGVDCGGVIRLLLERALIRMVGKKEEAGRPILYGSTKQFLEFFHLRDLKDLPTLKEFTELSEEHAAQLDQTEPPDGETQQTASFEGQAPLAVVEEATPAIVAISEPGETASVQPVESTSPTFAVAEEDMTSSASSHVGEPSFAEAAKPVVLAIATEPNDSPVEPLEAERTWPRQALLPEEDEDTVLNSLDRALDKVDGILRDHQRSEKARIESTLAPFLEADTTNETKSLVSTPAEALQPETVDESPGV